MSIHETVTWVCDRCKAEVEVSPKRSQPHGWLGVAFISPPLKDFSETTRWHLCKDCDTALANFLFPRRGGNE